MNNFQWKISLWHFLLHSWLLTGKIVHVSTMVGPLVCLSVKNDIHALSGHQLALIWCVTLYYRKQGLEKPQDYTISLSLSRFFQELLFKTNCRFFCIEQIIAAFPNEEPKLPFSQWFFCELCWRKNYPHQTFIYNTNKLEHLLRSHSAAEFIILSYTMQFSNCYPFDWKVGYR